jgi:hypothetical protein
MMGDMLTKTQFVAVAGLRLLGKVLIWGVTVIVCLTLLGAWIGR